jgi:ribosomal protein S1
LADRVDRSIANQIDAILNAKTDNFVELCKLAGINPMADFQNAVIRGADFSGCNLSEFNFTNSTFLGGSFRQAVYGTAIFKGTRFSDIDLSEAEDWAERQQAAPITFVDWTRDSLGGEFEERSSKVLGKILTIDDRVVVIDVGGGFCRRINRSLLQEALESVPDFAHGATIEIPEKIVEECPAIFVGEDNFEAKPLTWYDIKNAFETSAIVFGMIYRSVKGGYLVRLGLEIAFLPGGQVDRTWPPDVSDMLDIPQPFEVLSIGTDDQRNIIVSRLAAVERAEAEMQRAVLETFRICAKVQCKVERLTKRGIVVTVDGIGALIHQSAIPPELWQKADSLFIQGQMLQAVIVRIEHETQYVRLSLMDEVQESWKRLIENYHTNDKVSGVVASCKEDTVFVDLGGVTGGVHVGHIPNEHRLNLEKFYPVGAAVDAVLRGINRKTGRIDLSFSDLDKNPWPSFVAEYQKGDVVSGTVSAINEYGLFVEVSGIIGLAPGALPDDFGGKVGDTIVTKIVAIYAERSRLRLALVAPDTPLTDTTIPTESVSDIYSRTEIGAVFDLTISKISLVLEMNLGRQKIGFAPSRKLAWKAIRFINKNKDIILNRSIKMSVIDKDHARESLVFGTSDINSHPFDDFVQLFRVGDFIQGIVSFSNTGMAIVNLEGGIFADVDFFDVSEWKKNIGEWKKFSIIEIDTYNKIIKLKVEF